MAHPTPRDPVVVEPVVNREKLLELLALETEYSTLDFKSRFDLGDKRDVVELAKHVGAMSVRGGYLVIGVDGHGKPTGDLTTEQAARFDEAQLRPKLLRWLPDELEVCSQVHELDGHQVVLLHISPNPAGCAIFRADGQYDDGGKSSKVVFREGEVFFRDGTQSVRLDHRGLEQVIRQRVERERVRWETDHAEGYRRLAEELRTGAAGQQVARGPAVEFNLALEPEVLTEAATELLRADDDIPLRRLLRRAAPEARAFFTAEDQEGLAGLLDRLTSLAATFLELDRTTWFERVVDTLASIYELGFENVPPIYNNPPPRSAVLWLALVERAVALGALAVRYENWEAVRYIASRRPEGMDKFYTTWLRHASTMAARAELYVQQGADDDFVGLLLNLAREVVRRLAPLRPDASPEDDKILTSLTRFDVLAALVSLADSGNRSGLYPHFARFDGTRVEPVARRLLRDTAMRITIYPGDDRHFAVALREIDRAAQRAVFRYGGWDGYPADVNNFISLHAGETE
ncbi:ATP-binding protein [Saccharothrix deserti]|uniref:ATP-binding protein n=1 Tax=Saccharothrix deserti TaxID=2593674 RepID=UPI00131DD315|nr:ATP-binding protein [Saccharothrix deserti]